MITKGSKETYRGEASACGGHEHGSSSPSSTKRAVCTNSGIVHYIVATIEWTSTKKKISIAKFTIETTWRLQLWTTLNAEEFREAVMLTTGYVPSQSESRASIYYTGRCWKLGQRQSGE